MASEASRMSSWRNRRCISSTLAELTVVFLPRRPPNPPPPRVPLSLQHAGVRITAVATGGNHTLAVGACGGIWACGRGRHGQLGLGNFRDAGPLTQVETLRGARIVAASAGQAHSLAVTEVGDVRSGPRAPVSLSSLLASRP